MDIATLRDRYKNTKRKHATDIREILRMALAAHIPVHILCRTEERNTAVREYGEGGQLITFGWVEDSTASNVLRIEFADLVSADPK